MKGKKTFLAVYDYGKGGIWFLMDARSRQEIEEKYPSIKVFEDRPDWMTEEEKNRKVASYMKAKKHWDIDAEPTGWLAGMIREEKESGERFQQIKARAASLKNDEIGGSSLAGSS